MSFELQLVQRAGGWGLLDNGKPLLWFPEWPAAVEVAQTMAEARNAFHGLPAYVHALGSDGSSILLAAYE